MQREELVEALVEDVGREIATIGQGLAKERFAGMASKLERLRYLIEVAERLEGVAK